MTQGRIKQESLLKYLVVCGVAAPILFTVLAGVGGALYEGYSHATQAVSELGGVEAEHPEVQNVSFILVGTLTMLFALGVHRGITGGVGSRVGPLLIGLFGLILAVAQPALPCDAGCEFETFTGTMHNVTGTIAFFSMIGGIIVISRRAKRDPNWHAYGRKSLMLGIAVFVAWFVWIFIGESVEIDVVVGTMQRVMVGLMFVWMELTAFKLLRSPQRLLTANPA